MSGINGLENHLRATIGTREENSLILSALSSVLDETSGV